MSGVSRIRSMNVADTEVRQIFGPAEIRHRGHLVQENQFQNLLGRQKSLLRKLRWWRIRTVVDYHLYCNLSKFLKYFSDKTRYCIRVCHSVLHVLLIMYQILHLKVYNQRKGVLGWHLILVFSWFFHLEDPDFDFSIRFWFYVFMVVKNSLY